MGQSRFPKRYKDCLFQVYVSQEFEALTAEAEYLHQPWAEGWSKCADRATFQLLFEYEPHDRGQRRREHLGHKAGVLTAVLQYPHDAEVLPHVRRCFSPEAAEQYIPALQAVGRQLLRKDWTAIASYDGMGAVALQYWSSIEYARSVLPPEEFSQLAYKDASVFAEQAGVIA